VGCFFAGGTFFEEKVPPAPPPKTFIKREFFKSLDNPEKLWYNNKSNFFLSQEDEQ